MKAVKIGFWTFLIIIITSFYGCKNNSSSNSDYSNEDETETEIGYKTDTYCAEVEYYNPNTGTRSTYTLNVEVEDNELVKIHWPNGGWLDDSHFNPEELDSSGFCSFTSDRGYQYEIQIKGSECSFTDDASVRNDAQDEEDAVTCPKCGYDKETYETMCYSCERKIKDVEEHTCKRCGNYDAFMFSMDDYCSDCEKELKENEDY